MTNVDVAKPVGEARRHDLDWLRFIAIIILLFYHTGMLFVPWPWHVKNNELSVGFTYWMVWLHAWRMPLLLFISGAGTYMALGKRTPKAFAGERSRKLLIPLTFGMFVIVPPQIYFEHIDAYHSYGEFYKTVFDFIPYPKGSFSWHHLWFVAYLFLFSMIALPYLTFLRSMRSKAFSNLTDVLGNPWAMLFVPSGIIFLSQLLLRPFFPKETHAIFDDWAYFTFYFFFFFWGITCYSNKKVWTSIGDNRFFFLVGTAIILIPFYVAFLHFREVVTLPFEMRTIEIAFEIVDTFVSWFCVITVIAFGQHYLNKPHPWLKHFNEGLYPFYILHQTVIVVLGYYVCQLAWGIQSKFWFVSVATFVICIAIYFLLIRPSNLMRLFFGMKKK